MFSGLTGEDICSHDPLPWDHLPWPVVNSALCVQFTDGVILLLLIGQLEGFFIPLHDFILTPCQSSEKVQYRFHQSCEPLVIDVHPSERTATQQRHHHQYLCYEAVNSSKCIFMSFYDINWSRFRENAPFNTTDSNFLLLLTSTLLNT